MLATGGRADGLGLVLVVGATGRVGREVVAGLQGRADFRPSYATTPPAGHDRSWVRLDLLDSNTFTEALAGVSAIFLMRPPRIAKASLIEPFLLAARRVGIRRLVFLSVKGAERNPILPHHGMERLIERSGFEWTHVRPSDFMQNLETEHLASIMEKGEIAVPAGKGRSAFIDVADVGEVVVHSLLTAHHVGKGYTLTGPAALDFEEVANLMSGVMRRPIRYRDVSLPGFVFEKRAQGVPLGLCLVMAALYTVQRFGFAAETTDTVRRLIGHAPTDFATYARSRFGIN